MALSTTPPTSAKVKPVLPPKPTSPNIQSSFNVVLADGSEGEFLSGGRRQTLSPSTGLGVQLVKESNAKFGDATTKDQLETHQSRSHVSASLTRFTPRETPVTQSQIHLSAINKPKNHPSTRWLDSALETGKREKPPLLPKPVSIASRSSVKPPIPKRPDVHFLARKSVQDSGTQTLPLGSLVERKSVFLEKISIPSHGRANRGQFETIISKGYCENPVRPPRSPKNKPFTGMPFDSSSFRQTNASTIEKTLSLPHGGGGQRSFLWSHWEAEERLSRKIEKPLSFHTAKGKTFSLERSISVLPAENASSRGNIGLRNPIPPPRRVKKKFSTGADDGPFLSIPSSENNNIPEYAVVNYELKKNRRLQNVQTSTLNTSQEDNAVSDILSSSAEGGHVDGAGDVHEADFTCHLQSNSPKIEVGAVEKCEGSEEHGSCKNNNNLSDKYVEGVDKDIKYSPANLKPLTETEVDGKCSVPCCASTCRVAVSSESASNSSELIRCNCVFYVSSNAKVEVSENVVLPVHNDLPDGRSENPIVYERMLEKQTGEVIIGQLKDVPGGASLEKAPSTKLHLKRSDLNASNREVAHTLHSLPSKTSEDNRFNNFDKVISQQETNEAVALVKNDPCESELDHTSESTLVVTEQSNIFSETSLLPSKINSNAGESLRKTSSESDCSPWADAVEDKRSDDEDYPRSQRNESSMLHFRSKLSAGHPGNNDQTRRQSWTDGQKKENSAPSWSGASKQRRKRRGRSFWCDEGDLSSGALGDQSSFEDAPLDEKCGEGSTTRSRLSAIFSSFGKNSRKSHLAARKLKEKKVVSKDICKFYCESETERNNLQSESSAVETKAPSIDSLNSGCSEEEEKGREMEERLEESEVDSGMSGLCMKVDSLDLKRQSAEFGSGSHISEQSFDMAPSESENEEMSLPEEKLDASLSERQRREKKAFFIAQEMMTSERVFVDALRLLCIDFPNAIANARSEQKTEIVSDADLSKILNNLPQLLSFNEDLLHDLEERIDNWKSSQKISDIIVRKGPFLKLYTSYFQIFETQCQYLDEYCDSSAHFAQVVRDFEASPRCQRLALKHYMLKPIQRLPQYRLLLEEYMAELDPESPDYNDTKVALSIVCGVADHANRSMKQGDTLSKLLQLQSLMKNYAIIKPGRNFIKEGELQKLCRKGLQSRYFILLNDCLLCAASDRSVQSPLKVNYELPLNGMKVEIPVAEDYNNEFSIISTTRSFTLSASSPQERREWVSALLKAIEDYTSRQQTFLQMKLAQSSARHKGHENLQLGMAAPVWIQDCRVTMCQSCTSEFTVTFRRHHCRACGKVVCGNCSANKAPLQYMKFQAKRVCDECYDSLLKDFDENHSSQEALQRKVNSSGLTDPSLAPSSIRESFKKLGTPTSGKKMKKYIPQRLKEVCANDTGSQMSGWLHRRCRKSWKKMWFVLKDQVLYVYKASEDVVALESIPILGYQVLGDIKLDDVESGVAFSLTHKGKQYLEFQADNVHSAKRWIHAMQEATVLK